MSIFFSNPSIPIMLAQQQVPSDPSQKYDIYVFGDNPSLTTVYSIAQHYNTKDPTGGKSSSDYLKDLNNEIYNTPSYSSWIKAKLKPKGLENWKWDHNNLQKGVLVFLPKAAAAGKKNVGGDTKSTKKMYIAWSIDDGPTWKRYGQDEGFTDITNKIQAFFAGKNIDAITWFIVQFRIKNWRAISGGESKQKGYQLIQGLQSAGNEIGIHTAQSPEQGAWFPDKSLGANGYDTITDGLKAQKAFWTELKSNGITAKFYRPPGGLHSEVMKYLKDLGYSGADAMASDIILEKPNAVNSTNSTVVKVRDAVDELRTWLSQNSFELGPGRQAFNGNQYGDYKKNVLGLDKWDWNAIADWSSHKNTAKARIEDEIDDLSGGVSTAVKHFVILTHDTRKGYYDRVVGDVTDIDAYAKSKGVKIVYKTMSQIYEQIHGVKP